MPLNYNDLIFIFRDKTSHRFGVCFTLAEKATQIKHRLIVLAMSLDSTADINIPRRILYIKDISVFSHGSSEQRMSCFSNSMTDISVLLTLRDRKRKAGKEMIVYSSYIINDNRNSHVLQFVWSTNFILSKYYNCWQTSIKHLSTCCYWKIIFRGLTVTQKESEDITTHRL